MKKIYFPFNLPLKRFKTFCFLLVIFLSISSYGQDVKNHLHNSLPGSGTLEIPAGVGMSGNSIKVQTWGAGGGGGGPATLLGLLNVLNVGGGGGGGAFHEGSLNNVGEDPDNIKIAYTIGAGGAGGTPTTVDGRNGGNSFFSTVSANGGKGGAAGILLGGILNLYASNGIGGQGGQGGNFSGGDGFTAGLLGQGIGLVSGGGGGGAGSGGAGKGSNVDILSQAGGAGGIANGSDGGAGGKGGDGITASNLTHGNGLAGGFPAGGGGGSITVLDVIGLFGRPSGGAGANGQIKVTYTCPVYTVSNITADPVCVAPGTTVVTLNGFLPIGKYTVTYDVSSPSQTGLQAANVRVTTTGTLKFTVTGLTTVGTSRITIKNIRSVDCSTNIDKYVDVTVNPNLNASVSIAASPSGAICYGTPVTFTATPTNGGTAPVYQWRINGVNVAGANAVTYTNSTLINGDVVSCVMTSNASPCLTGSPATSNSITMTVSGPAANPVTVCIGGAGSLTASGCVDGSAVSVAKNPSARTNSSTGSSWTINTATASSKVTVGILGSESVITNNLQATTFGFAIPSNAKITGIQVVVNRYSSDNSSSRYVRDNTIQLIKTTGVVGVNKAVTASNWLITSSNVNYGNESDLWGTTWTPAEINSSSFGVALAVNISASGLLGDVTTATVSSIGITVTYYIPNPVNWYTVSSGGTSIGTGTSFNPVGVANSGLANTNIAGTHTYYAACSSAPECRTPVKFIISGVPTIATISTPAALCTGGILNPSVPSITTNSSVITASGWQLETAVGSGTYANLTVPYTVSLADSGKHIRYYVNANCATVYSDPVSITVNSILAPVIGTPTEPICTAPTANVVVNGLSGSWIINATPNVGLTGLTGSGATATIAGLTPGTTYNFTFSNGNCTSANFSVVVKKLPVKTWKNGVWDGADPTIDEKVLFESDYNINKSVTACSCEVKSGAVVVFNSGYYLKLRNELIVDSNGSLTFENNASLVQINNVLNTGIINYKRITTPVNRYDFTYWSSPVVGMTLKQLSPGTFYDKYFKYNNAWVSIVRETAMDIGEGYSVRAPQIIAISGNPANYPAVFKGVPFNGEIRKNLAGDKVYLLGNPYPSAISADAFLLANETKLQGTLYFWTHNSPPSEYISGDKKYNYTANDYATYNRTGGTATKAAIPDSNLNYPDINSNIPNGYITAAQGFFAPTSVVGGEIVFNNSMRLLTNEVMDNSQFFKLSDTSKSNVTDATTTIEKNRVWLNLTNEEGAFKQTLVGYITGATNDYEGKFDGVSYDGNEYLDFYSVRQDLNLAIQGRALPFQEKDSIVLGYKSAIKGDFKISIDHLDGVLSNQQIFVEDKDLQVLHDLKKAPYSFTTEKGIFNNRFVLRYEDKNAVIEDVDVPVEGVVISTKNKIITIAADDAIIETVAVYDFSGKLVYADNEVNLESTTISNLSTAHQALIVQVVLENGKKAVKKIIY
ncbi:T9SS sorting signal type C domain-containing protein [Flavobacterium seoulense]|uniref:Glycine-rich domain-containing protein n=1 Tax=Flavobacterium seoulense TaxID=1492738 RepID=A0A066WRC1_9FLAO|nr:T9SS sorting signal type C domain-containing protein [Flavobacterium seoulense]KDN56607.1 hypothetical protein FEM21_01100 [Flavobacterium seoulense]